MGFKPDDDLRLSPPQRVAIRGIAIRDTGRGVQVRKVTGDALVRKGLARVRTMGRYSLTPQGKRVYDS